MSRNRIGSDSDMETDASSPPSSRDSTPEPQMPKMTEDKKIIETLRKENEELRRQLKQVNENTEALKALVSSLQDTVRDFQAQAAQASAAQIAATQAAIAQAVYDSQAAKRKEPEASSSSDEERSAPKKPAPLPARQMSAVPSTSREPSQNTAAQPLETPTPATAQPKAPAIPPVVLRNKEQWTAVSNRIREKGVNYSKAKLTSQGVAITPQTPEEDYRKLTKTFNDDSTEYHTYSLPEDRTLRLVIRGIPEGVENDQVRQDLLEQNFNIISVHRLTSRRNRQPLPLLLVQVPQHQTEILEVRRCCGLVVRVERQRRSTEPTQCHRCQRFGHAQSMCRAAAKCVKCGQAHHSTECRKTKDTPAKCANCNGDHPASYRGCPMAPKKQKAPPRQAPQTQRPSRPAATRVAGVSYAQQAAGKKQEEQFPALPQRQQKPIAPQGSLSQAAIQEQMAKMITNIVTVCMTNMSSQMSSLFQVNG